jgi:hypothetical protein
MPTAKAFVFNERRIMQIKSARIVDRGRGPQIEGSRVTVMDVFRYLHRGYQDMLASMHRSSA